MLANRASVLPEERGAGRFSTGAGSPENSLFPRADSGFSLAAAMASSFSVLPPCVGQGAEHWEIITVRAQRQPWRFAERAEYRPYRGDAEGAEKDEGKLKR